MTTAYAARICDHAPPPSAGEDASLETAERFLTSNQESPSLRVNQLLIASQEWQAS